MKSINIFLLLIFFAFVSQADAQESKHPVAYDSSVVDLRSFDQAEVDNLKSDSDFDYGESVAAINLWERFKRWIANILNLLVRTVSNASWLNLLVYILVIVGLVYVILRLMRIDALSLFYRNKKSSLPYAVLEEDIHGMDFDKLISEALESHEYRLAIRLQFLQALKLLTDHQYVYWQPGKTNHDYLDELKADHLKAGFTELNHYFEYAWYGNFSVNETLYKKVDLLYKDWKTSF
jgi:hypothetical protein